MAETDDVCQGLENSLNQSNANYEQLRRGPPEENTYTSFILNDNYEQLRRGPTEENTYTSFILNDNYEQLQKGTIGENPYSSCNVDAGTGTCTTGFDYNHYENFSQETNSLQPILPMQCRLNRKWIGSIGAITFGLILVATVVVIFVSKDGTNYYEKSTEKNDRHGKTEVTTHTDTSLSSTDATMRSSGTTPYVSESPWLSWSDWSVCSATCGDGVHVRYRTCNQVVGCQGNYKEIQECFESSCPIHGSWTVWSKWANCDVTCGSGKQIRTRTCKKSNADDKECIGKNINEQICDSGICPDCSMVCESGTLNSACNICICSQVISGRVVSSNQAPLQNVSLHLNSAANEVLTTTDPFGEFQLTNVCLHSVVVFIKEGFAEMHSNINSSSVNITLIAIEAPYITIQPQPKSRLLGENVRMCCSANGIPDITYYEWFRDKNVLDERLYPDGTTLLLTDVNTSHAGKYRCRANSAFGSIMSSAADLDVKDSSDGFCLDAYEQKKKELPYDCVQLNTNSSAIEVGDCKPNLCRLSRKGHETNSCRDDIQNCCSISDFEMMNIQCTDYQLSVLKVISCGCGSCESSRVKISGTVKFYDSKEVAKFFQVYFNGKFKTYTNKRGSFKVDVDENYDSAVLTVLSWDGHSTTKVLDISQNTKGTIFTTIYVIDASTTVDIDPTKENIIYIGKDLNDSKNAVAELHIPRYSFVDSSYQLQSGSVKLSVSYLDAKNISDMDVMPGQLSHVNQRGVIEYLKTFGTFRIKVFNSEKNEIQSVINKINVVVGYSLAQYAHELSLYKLNTVSGVWDKISAKDEFSGVLSSSEMSSWVTVGQPANAKTACYFNVRAFEDSSLTTEIVNSRYQFFIHAVHISDHSSFKTDGHSFSPSSSCFQTFCSGTKGYLEMWISNMEKASDEFLLPANPEIHADIGMTLNKQEWIQYSTAPGDEHLKLLFINSTEGPFFNSESSCLANSRSHFKFYFNDFIENVFTVRLYFDIYTEQSEKMRHISQRVWYQRRSEGYRVCFVKAKFNMQSDKSVRVRAISYGGTNVNITKEILGIREAKIFESSAVCIEFKCSGTIDEYLSSGEYDFTQVSIYTDTPCSVESFSQPLIDKFSNINPNNSDASIFLFYAPIEYSPELGIYSASTSSGDIESARTISKGECHSGKIMDYFSDNPETGVAVTFTCP